MHTYIRKQKFAPATHTCDASNGFIYRGGGGMRSCRQDFEKGVSIAYSNNILYPGVWGYPPRRILRFG